MDRGPWQATVHRVTKSQTQLKQLSTPKWNGASQVALMVKNPPASAAEIKDMGLIPGLGRSLEEGMATHSSILAWRNPGEPGGLQSIVLQRVRHE